MKQVKRTATQAQKERWLNQIIKEFELITFTDAACIEMKERLQGAFLEKGFTVPEVPVTTFNSFAMDIVSEFCKELGYHKKPQVIDVNQTKEAESVLPLVIEDKIPGLNYNMAVELPTGALTVTIKTFKLMKAKQIAPTDPEAKELLKKELTAIKLYPKHMSDQSIERLIELYDEYNSILKSQGLLTFADQEPLALAILNNHPDYIKNLGIKHLVVDEFQDSSDIQMEFIKRFSDPAAGLTSTMAIGDDNQSIYGFREANPDNMIHYEEKLGYSVEKLQLTNNYRSRDEIISLANNLVAMNVNRIDKPLIAAKGAGGKTSVRGFYNTEDEFKYIVDTITRLIEEGKDPSDIVVIAMTKKELGKISAALGKAGIPWVMMAPVKVIENSRVNAAIKLADAFYEPEATQSYIDYLIALNDGKLKGYIPDAEIQRQIDELYQMFANIDLCDMDYQTKKFHDMIEALDPDKQDEIFQKWLEQVYLEDSLEDELTFIRNFKRFGKDTELKMDCKYKGVALTTAHSSKGLEWDVVINTISGYDTKRYHTGRNKQDEIEEKRRLLFVSMTRAKEELYVTGQYVLCNDEKYGEMYNMFLKDLYSIVDPSLKSYVPNDPMKAIRAEQRRLERNKKAREKRAAKKFAMMDDADIDLNAKSRQMTKAEIEEYEKLVKNAVQASLFS